MIQGLAEQETGVTSEPGTVAGDVAPEERFTGQLRLYLRASVPEAARSRQRAVLERLETFEAAGVVEALSVTEWPDRVRLASTPSTESAARTYETLVDAVGREALEPFFEERPAVGPVDRAVVFPVICVTAHRGDDLVGLFPRWTDGSHHAVSDCLRALASGDCIENATDTA